MAIEKASVAPFDQTTLESWELSSDMHPDLAAFAAYWRSKRHGDGTFPRFDDINPAEISRLMPGVVILKRTSKANDGTDNGWPGDDFSYVYVGATHYDANGLDLTGRFVSDVYSDAVVEEALNVWREILRTGQIHYWGRPNPLPDREMLSYERVLMPMADADGIANMLIGFWIWN